MLSFTETSLEHVVLIYLAIAEQAISQVTFILI